MLSFIDQHFIYLTPIVANLIPVEILFFLVSRYKNLGELCKHFALQIGSPWTNLAEIWLNGFPVAEIQDLVCKF